MVFGKLKEYIAPVLQATDCWIKAVVTTAVEFGECTFYPGFKFSISQFVGGFLFFGKTAPPGAPEVEEAAGGLDDLRGSRLFGGNFFAG